MAYPEEKRKQRAYRRQLCLSGGYTIQPNRPNSIMLSSSRAGLRLAGELDSVMEFGLKYVNLQVLDADARH